jgi:hypothetical protein
MMYAGDGCTKADGGGGMAIFMLDLVEERVVLRASDSSEAEAMVCGGGLLAGVEGLLFKLL